MEYLVVAAYAALAFFSLLFSYLVWSRFAKKPRNLPAEAAGARFLVGHLDVVSGRVGLPHVNLANLADENGPIFRIRLGVHPAVVVSSWEAMRECFTTNDRVFATRPSIAVGKYFYDGASFGMSQYGPYWRDVRKMVTVDLLTARRLDDFGHVRVEEVDRFAEDLYSMRRPEEAVALSERIELLTFNIILRMLVGKRFSFTK